MPIAPVFAILDFIAFIILLLLAVATIRAGVLWALKDFEKWKVRRDGPQRQAMEKEDRLRVKEAMEAELRRPAGPREEAQYRR